MIKECYVKLNNEAVTVVNFDGVDVQFPAIKREAKTVFVKFENGKYSITDKPVEETKPVIVEDNKETDNKETQTSKGNGKKKTTNKTAKVNEVKEDNENA